MQYLKADTAVKVVVGPVVAVGDGFTPITTLSLSTADEAEIMKHDAAAVTSISANTFAAITSADGYYNLTITAGQLDTEGMLTVLVNDDSLCLPVRNDFMVVNANVFDSLFAAATTDYLQVDTLQLGGTTQSATDLKDFADAGYDPATNKVQGVVLTDTATTVTGGATAAALATAQTDLDTLTGTDGVTLATSQANYVPSKAGDAMTLTAAATSAQLVDDVWDEVLTGATHNIAASAGRRMRAIGDVVSGTVNDASATITSFISTLTGGHDDHFSDQTLYFIDGNLAGMSRIITTYTSATKEITFDEALPEAPGNGDAFDVNPVHVHTQSQIADVVWDEVVTGHTINNTTGKILKGISEGWIADEGSVNDVSATTTTFISDLTNATSSFFRDTTVAFISGALKGQTRIVSDYNGTTKAFTFDEAFTSAPANTDQFIVLAQHTHTITTIKESTRAEMDSNSTQLAAIVADTNELQTDDVPGLIAALNNISVSDVLTTQMTEAYAADGTAPTLAQAIFLIQQTIGDFSITGTTLTAKKLDGTTTAATYTLDDAADPTSRTRAT